MRGGVFFFGDVTMRIFSLLALSVLNFGMLISVVQAECYGDAADAYGCGVQVQRPVGKSTKRGPSLEKFGSDEGPVLPDVGYYNQGQSSSDVITPEERHRMMRGIVLGRAAPTRSRSAQMQAVNSAARPVRRSGSMPVRTR